MVLAIIDFSGYSITICLGFFGFFFSKEKESEVTINYIDEHQASLL